MWKLIAFAVAGLLLALFGVLWSGVIEDNLFNVWDPNPLDPPPAEAGPFTVDVDRVEVADGADGEPFGITVYAPVDAEGPLPTFAWVMGSNVQAYYHEELHETLASWGYLVVVPDTRPLRFLDLQYHGRVVALAEQAIDIALDGGLGVAADPERLAVGGYSVGGPLAAFTVAGIPDADAVVHWAPSPAPFWQGIDGDARYAQVDDPSFYLFGSVDPFSPAAGGPADGMQAAMSNAPVTEVVIEGASHHQFQQPLGSPGLFPPAEISMEDQQRQAIEATLAWLDEQFDIGR